MKALPKELILVLFTILTQFQILFAFGVNAKNSVQRKTISVVTGANGYVGREIVHTLLSSETREQLKWLHNNDQEITHEVVCLVRPSRVKEEERYWDSYVKKKEQGNPQKQQIKVLPYDMLDKGESLSKALNEASRTNDSTDKESNTHIVLYHVASKFGPSENHEQIALENVAGTEDTVRILSNYPNSRLILTSSMAAVRGTGQKPLYHDHESYYTHQDWNTMSELGKNWGNSYQWSKCQSEKRAWELAKELGIHMTSLCPSFVFGPYPTPATSTSYSIQLVSQWIKGESSVQSRLCVDIRDVALAHVRAACRSNTIGKRYIISSEARLRSQDIATVLKLVCQNNVDCGLGNGDTIFCDENFDGGAVKIGEKEVDAKQRMKDDLDMECRNVRETFRDMGLSMIHEFERA